MIGQPLKRLEDPRLLRGEGQFLEDLRVDGLAHVAILRSPHARAAIHTIDTAAARALPGVIAVVTAQDLTGIGGVPAEGYPGMPVQPPLARGTVRFAGESVAAVVAETAAVARDAVDAIGVDYEVLPAIVDAAAALEPGAELVHPELGSNVAASGIAATGDVDAAFAAADRRLGLRVSHARVAALPIETRGGIAAYDVATATYTLWLTTQTAWLERAALATALGIEEERIRVITPDVGGGFGMKGVTYPEDILLLCLARITGRPVRWVSTRSEDLLSSMHGREATTDVEVAFDDDGRIRALRLRTVANLGAYLMRWAAYPVTRMLYLATGAYAIEHLHSEVVGVFTHTGPVGPYRGAGRSEASYCIERVVSEVAHALGKDQAAVRRRNFIPPDAFPWTNPAGLVYDSGDYQRALDRALELIDAERVQREIGERRVAGEVVGIGIATGTQSAGGGWESARMTLDSNGRVRIVTGSSPHGQGLETSYAQIVSSVLGVPLADIEIAWGDTAIGPPGQGTYASRSLQLGGTAIHIAATEIASQLRRIAATLLEVAPDDLVLGGRAVTPAGAPERALSVPALVRAWLEQYPDESVGIDALVAREEGRETFPFGAALAVVALDRDTGRPWVERLVVVHDCGTVVNPLIVEGQLSGGIVQGLGETLWEHVRYDADGQLLAGTLMDYAAPRATTQGPFEIARTVTPTPRNPLGVKGVGELGTVLAPAAVANAIADALRPFGVGSLGLPLADEMLWRVIEGIPNPDPVREWSSP
jgi:carbon-monoxide dehydrogenase large subunit